MGEQSPGADRPAARPIEDVLRENRFRFPQFVSLWTSSSAETMHLGQSGEVTRSETLDPDSADLADTSE